MSTSNIQHVLKTSLPHTLALIAKRTAVYPRYFAQVQACKAGFRQFGDHYSKTIVFIAGLPKSGTSWLKKMISSFPGFHELLIPDVASHETSTGGSHDYKLPDDFFSRFKNMLVVTKMHVDGSLHNAQLLHEAGVRYVILYRDLRDVAVSYYFYVRQTPWHPQYPTYSRLSLERGLATFADRLLPEYVQWIRSWHDNRDSQLSLVLRYEDMLADTESVLSRVAKHFELDTSPATIQDIVREHSFQNLSGGRDRGEASTNSFFRKGTSGDWKNHFTPELIDQYKTIIGDFLIEFGYETDYSWITAN